MAVSPERKIKRDDLALRLLAEGRTLAEVASRCRVSVATIHRRLGARIASTRRKAGGRGSITEEQ